MKATESETWYKTEQTYSRDSLAIEGDVPCVATPTCDIVIASLGADRATCEQYANDIVRWHRSHAALVEACKHVRDEIPCDCAEIRQMHAGSCLHCEVVAALALAQS